jgi:transcription-repair coupling factor (superfamily II helicase)
VSEASCQLRKELIFSELLRYLVLILHPCCCIAPLHSVDALRRLQALKELSKLGSGFELANRDLEIRGAGAIIGKQQSGVADRVGPEVYMALLQEAIEEAKGTNVATVPKCRLLIKAAEVILERGLPDDFLDAEQRDLASEMAMEGKSPRDITRMAREWTARNGGPLPSVVAAFLKIRILQAFGRRLGMEQVEAVGSEIVIQVPGWSVRVFEHLRSHISDTGGYVFTYDEDRTSLVVKQLGLQTPAKQLALLLGVLGELYTFLEGKENFGFD